mmetsp:Transcript_5619/g.16050  ORF Transcript_5619/g.16050 Transcript_5619/m.16050 type:complete len:300 (-) Transcript_5619:287-1186(-)|eukprot:CAMPEP_0206136102 /NCGR_PEP_ID=MMETSP1473-20131121/1333_1 /ASSEMBLY_ACC=CAM_ASM_001109 /TAXON_ID=1461547 /ORGANISM="Stichococcus sp, Strain RCC1054" /LENGTH=299 /DNA_ID=CAMNT_0053528373 /DNA_START=60 /DNA_END=959 /DNA_ORIENTATION=-
MSGKVAIITGATAGLGLVTARTLAAAGCTVVITGRTQEKATAAIDQIRNTGVKGGLHAVQLDLADQASIPAACDLIRLVAPRVDYLILNAGVMASKSYTKDGFEMQIGTNHFGHFTLTEGLLPYLNKQGRPVRIVVLSSKGHYLHRSGMVFDDLHFMRRRYIMLDGYAQSKLANVLFAKQLARNLEGTQITAYSLHPGSIQTTLSRQWAPPGSWMAMLMNWVFRLFGWILFELKTIEQGVATTIYAAVAPELEGHSGAYLNDCRIVKPSKPAQDPQQASKLWEVTTAQLAAVKSGTFAA